MNKSFNRFHYMCKILNLMQLLVGTLVVCLSLMSYSNIALSQVFASPQEAQAPPLQNPPLETTPPLKQKVKLRSAKINAFVSKKPILKNSVKYNTSYEKMVIDANAKTVSLVSGTVNGTYIVMANDISFVLDEADKLRVLPVIGRGGYENIYDVLLLRGIDMGFIRSDALEIAKKEGKVSDVANRLTYIAALMNDEMHVVTPETITSIEQLRGKRVNLDIQGSGTSRSGALMFERLGIEIVPSFNDAGTAYGMVARGEIEASLFIGAKPIRTVGNIPSASNLHLLDIPYDKRLEDIYYPASFENSDYPTLVPVGKSVSTIAAKTLLVTYNWPQNTERYKRVALFVATFFSKFEDFKKPNRHPKWREVNIAATFPGLPRFKAATDWLIHQSDPIPQNDKAKTELLQFLEEKSKQSGQNISKTDQDKLFDDFTRWKQNRQQ